MIAVFKVAIQSSHVLPAKSSLSLRPLVCDVMSDVSSAFAVSLAESSSPKSMASASERLGERGRQALWAFDIPPSDNQAAFSGKAPSGRDGSPNRPPLTMRMVARTPRGCVPDVNP